MGDKAIERPLLIGRSSNGRIADSDSASLGSNPSLPANFKRHYDANATHG